MSENSTLPHFAMPACLDHFSKGHRWWCRACDRETEAEFEAVAEAWWSTHKSEDICLAARMTPEPGPLLSKRSSTAKIPRDPF